MKIKTCFGCRHMTVENGYLVSEITGWCSGYWRCDLNHFYESPENEDREGLNDIMDKMLEQANACGDFEAVAK